MVSPFLFHTHVSHTHTHTHIHTHTHTCHTHTHTHTRVTHTHTHTHTHTKHTFKCKDNMYVPFNGKEDYWAKSWVPVVGEEVDEYR